MRKKRGKKRVKEEKKEIKKGLSTVLVMLILILVSIASVSIVWVVVKNVLQSESEHISLGQYTLKAEIMNVKLNNLSNDVNLILKRGQGEGEFSDLSFVFYDGKDFESVMQVGSLTELEERQFNIHLNNLTVSHLVSISVTPILSLNGEEEVGNVMSEYTLREDTNVSFTTSWTDLKVWLKFEDDSSDNRTVDSSYYSRNVTCSGGYCPIYLPTGGPDGSGAYDFDGINNYSMTIINPLSGPPEWTYAVWFYPRSNGTSVSALIGQGNNPAIRWGGPYNRVSLFLYWSYSPGYKQIGSPDLTLNQWHHVVGIVNSSEPTNQTMYLYVDGVRVSSAFWINGTIGRPSATHYINIRDSARSFNGILDSIRVYNRSLSQTEILSLNNSKT